MSMLTIQATEFKIPGSWIEMMSTYGSFCVSSVSDPSVSDAHDGLSAKADTMIDYILTTSF